MKEITEQSAGAILYNEKTRKFLLLKRVNNPFWEFPKGHIEKDEAPSEALKREITEETGIKKAHIIKEIDKIYFTIQKDNLVKKRIIIYYLVKTREEIINLSPEHSEYLWVNCKDVLNYLEFDDIKKIFQKVINDSIVFKTFKELKY